MPELPEIESLRRALEPSLVGASVHAAHLFRADMMHRAAGAPARPLAVGDSIRALHRRGKQLVIESASGPCLLVHLGMSGSLRLLRQAGDPETHVHARWDLRSGRDAFSLRHRDPRRFGWLESHASLESVHARAWSTLGPDALFVEATELVRAIDSSRRPIKALLLDQARIAGLGNIYVDEVLFRQRVHPLMQARKVPDVAELAHEIRSVLHQAVELGGSTIRDHRTAEGRWGSFQERHGVYGRAGLPCLRCGTVLRSIQVSQRTTVFCPRCQSRKAGRGGRLLENRS